MKALTFYSFLLATSFAVSAQKDPYFIKDLHKGLEANCVSFSVDGSKVVAGFFDGSVKILDVATGKTEASGKEHFKGVMTARIDPKGRYFVTGGDNTLRIWGMDGKLISTLKNFINTIYSCDLDPTGQYMVAGAMSRDFKVFDVLKAEMVRNVTGHTDVAMVVKYSRDGKLIASGSGDHTIKLWNAENGELLRTIPSHPEDIYGIDFSYDGKLLASCSKDKTIRIYSIETGELVKTLKGHKNYVMGVAFAPDNIHLLSCSFDQEIRVWEIPTGKSVYSYIDHEGQVTDIEFAPDGKTFASASHDKTVKLWNYSNDIFVDYYYSPVIIEKLSAMSEGTPKQKGESKEAYEARQAKFMELRNALYAEYYRRYLEDLSNNKLPGQ
jgi:WD40 repeat protein